MNWPCRSPRWPIAVDKENVSQEVIDREIEIGKDQHARKANGRNAEKIAVEN